MFRTVPLSIIRSFSLYTKQWYMSYGFADRCPQTCMTYNIAVCTVKTPDDGQRNCSKHLEFYSKNKFEKLVHLVGLLQEFITMHRHLNVKLVILLFEE